MDCSFQSDNRPLLEKLAETSADSDDCRRQQHDKHAGENKQNKGKDKLDGCFSRHLLGFLPSFGAQGIGKDAERA